MAGVVAQEARAGAATAARWRRCRRCRPTPRSSPRRSARPPRRRAARPPAGPPATTTMNTPCSRPRIRSGAADCRIVVRKTALTASAAPANAIATSAPHSAWVGVSQPSGAEQGDPEADDADAPADDAHHDRQALPPHRAEPPGRQRRQHRARPPPRRRGSPPCAAPPPRMTAPGRREQHPRLGQQHRRDVGDERHPHVRGAAQEAEAVEHRGQARPGSPRPPACGSGGSGCSRHSPHSAAMRDEGVGGVGRGEAAPVDEQPGHQRADHHRGRHREDAEGVGGRQLLARQDARVDALPRRRAHPERAVPHRHQHVEHPDVLVAEPGLQRARRSTSPTPRRLATSATSRRSWWSDSEPP